MTLRRLLSALARRSGYLQAPGVASAVTFETTNFVVNAPNADLARRFGEMAERVSA